MKLYLVSSAYPTGDLIEFNLFVSARDPEEAVRLWAEHYGITKDDIARDQPRLVSEVPVVADTARVHPWRKEVAVTTLVGRQDLLPERGLEDIDFSLSLVDRLLEHRRDADTLARREELLAERARAGQRETASSP